MSPRPQEQTSVVSCILQPQFEWEAKVKDLKTVDLNTDLELVADGRKGKTLTDPSVVEPFMNAKVGATTLK